MMRIDARGKCPVCAGFARFEMEAFDGVDFFAISEDCEDCQGTGLLEGYRFEQSNRRAHYRSKANLRQLNEVSEGVAEAFGRAARALAPALQNISDNLARALRRVQQIPRFECPVCNAMSWNPEDVRQGYCGRCHAWTGPQAPAFANFPYGSEILVTLDTATGWPVYTISSTPNQTNNNMTKKHEELKLAALAAVEALNSDTSVDKDTTIASLDEVCDRAEELRNQIIDELREAGE